MILISNVVNKGASIILIRLSFIVVTIGALGASFRYDVVAIYKLPVIFCALAGSGGLLWIFYKKRKIMKEDA